MPRYRMTLAYDGSSFHGWQIQPHDVSVQGVLESALTKLLRQDVGVVGAGRTDAGVHAKVMVAHFDTAQPIDDTRALANRLNAMVGNSIAVASIDGCDPEFHARFDAVKRTYRYFVHTVKSPFSNQYSWKAPASLDFEAMNNAAAMLLGTQDFTSFSKLHTDCKTNICTVYHAGWHKIDDNGNWYFEISADRFLRNMVRAVVGTLVDVGRGKNDIVGVHRIIAERNRCSAGTSMPAHPLFLWNVEY